MSIYNYKRRPTREVIVGHGMGAVAIGANNPVRIQSMTNTDTTDTPASASQSIRIAKAGGEFVRLTTQGTREASNMANIKAAIKAQGYDIPLVADVHFNPAAALCAAGIADKVRINPGNFVDPARTFRKLEYTDDEYAAEIEKIEKALIPLIDICKSHGTAIRIGVNHGSLSDRIMSRYGDTPEGMVESVMEYLRACRKLDFNDIVISVKASNPVVMTNTVRLLAKEMQTNGMDYPLHLGVTEAGGGEDGRVKSAVGIGSLLAEGLGDTIRVSLSEAPENEIAPAMLLNNYITQRAGHKPIPEPDNSIDACIKKEADRNLSHPIPDHPSHVPVIVGLDTHLPPDNTLSLDASTNPAQINSQHTIILSSHHINPVGEMASWIDRLRLCGHKNPVILKFSYPDTDYDTIAIKAGADLGFMLLHGYGSGIWIEAPAITRERLNHLSLGILQAVRLRISRTDYIACPSCGRTLFNLESTLASIQKATRHLTGLKIGVMGCIVNGPGEMADADYGYVGAGIGRVSLYKNKECVLKNIPEEDAVEKLIQIIKKNGDWKEPE